MSERRSYLKNTALVLAANAVSLIAAFILSPLIARFLAPAEYGVYALIFRTGSSLPMLLLLSMNVATMYYLARHQQDKAYTGRIIVTSLAFIGAMTVLCAFPIYVLLLAAVPLLGFWGFVATYFLGFAISLYAIVQSVQQGLERFKAYSVMSCATAVLANLVAFAAAYFLREAIATAFARGAVILLVGVIGLLAIRRFGPFDKDQLKTMLSYSKPLAVGGIVYGFIVLIDRYLLAAYHSSAEVGYFDVGSSFVTAVMPFIASLTVTMAPRVINLESKLDAYYRRIAAVSTVLLSLFGFGLIVFSDIIVNMLLGPAYVRGAVLPLRVLALSVPLMGLFLLNGTILSALKRNSESALLYISLVAVNGVLNFWFIPELASVGAAFATVGCYFVTGMGGMLYLRGRHLVSIRPTVYQLGLFLVFCLAYLLVASQLGFMQKAVFWLLFLLLSWLLHRKLAAEMEHEVLAAIRSLFSRRAAA